MHPLKILIIRFSSIGDIILTSPVIRCISRQLPNVEVHFLTKAKFSSLLTSNPFLSKVHVFEDSLDEVLAELRTESFDVIIDLHRNLRSLKVKRSIGVRSFTFRKLNIQKWLLVNFGINLLPETHIVHRYINTCKHLGVKYDGQGLDYFIPEGTDVSDFDLPVHYTAVAVGGTYVTKRLPPDMIQKLTDEIEGDVIILGDADDAMRMEDLVFRSGVHMLAGELSLDQCALVINNSKAVISHDTGLMHMAAAFKKKIISVWGNTVPEFGMGPLLPDSDAVSENLISEVKGLGCRPCSKLGFHGCPRGHFRCMREQDIQEITEKLR